jgi:hypothetical protein
VDRAQVAFDALVHVHPHLGHIPAREEAEKGSGGAEIAAPEPFLGDVEEDGAEEKKAEEKPLLEGLVEGEGSEELGGRISGRGEPHPVEKADESSAGPGEPGDNTCGKGAVEKRQRVGDTDEVDGKQAGDEDDDEDVIFPGQPSGAPPAAA